jgi:hypothetical protein
MRLWVRSTEGRRYRMKYVSGSGSDKISERRLTVRLGDRYTQGVFTALSRDVAADLARMDPDAVFSHIDRIRFRGDFSLLLPRVCL